MLVSRNSKTFQFAAYSATRAFSSSSKEYDVAVIGGGPGGYVAAIKAGQLGLKTVCIENRGTLGGTCLNVGCIPSKALLNISHKYHEAHHDFKKLGIDMTDLKYNFDTIQERKTEIVSQFCKNIEALLKKNKVDYIKGTGKFVSETELAIDLLEGGSDKINAKNVIIATGSEPSQMPGGVIKADEKIILTSTGALALKEVPKKMLVIGGGVIGLELGSVYTRLGTEVTVVEFMDKITPTMDNEVSQKFKTILEKQGMKFKLSSKVTGADVHENSATVHYENVNTHEKESIDVDVVLLAVGRRAYTQGLQLENVNIKTDKLGRIEIDNHTFCVLNKDNKSSSIRAIGDVVKGPMLAHKAEEEGIAAVELIANKGAGHVNYDAIPSVIYTHPEVAGVGKSEQELKELGVEYKKGSFPFLANSRAKANLDYDGFVKILTDKKTDKLLGAWIVGPMAGELIQELVLAIEYGACAEDVARTCHSHPTLMEAIKEACMAAYDKPIHM